MLTLHLYTYGPRRFFRPGALKKGEEARLGVAASGRAGFSCKNKRQDGPPAYTREFGALKSVNTPGRLHFFARARLFLSPADAKTFLEARSWNSRVRAAVPRRASPADFEIDARGLHSLRRSRTASCQPTLVIGFFADARGTPRQRCAVCISGRPIIQRYSADV